MFRSSYDHPQVYKSYHVHVLIVHRCFTVKRNGIPLCFKLLLGDSQQQFERSGVYCITCPDCNRKYIGQTSCSFQKRYKEHFHDYKYNKSKSSFATHILDNNHSMGPINEIMTYYTKPEKADLRIQSRDTTYTAKHSKITKLMTKTQLNQTPSLM